jgi:hypothetical protein
VLASGRTDLTQETLSTNWNGNVRVAEIDAHAYRSGISIAGSVVGSFRTGDPIGDVLVLADYAVGAAVGANADRAALHAARRRGAGQFAGLPPDAVQRPRRSAGRRRQRPACFYHYA